MCIRDSPEAEFGPVVDAGRGQNIRLAPDSTQHVNALELGKGYEAGEKPVSLKSEFILTPVSYTHLSVVDATQAKYTVDKSGVYNFSVRDYCGNILSYPVEVLSLIHI